MDREIFDPSDSIVLGILRAYWAVVRGFETRTGASHSRLLILRLFRRGVTFNKNQVANQLGFDRTVVHRVVRTMVEDGLLAETRSETGRQVMLSLTERGKAVREELILQKRALDRRIGAQYEPGELTRFREMLDRVAAMEKTTPAGQPAGLSIQAAGLGDEDYPADEEDESRLERSAGDAGPSLAG